MDYLVFFAKVIVAILPFLNRKSKLKGKWHAQYPSADTGEEKSELVELNQLWSLVWGTIKPVDNPADPEWQCYGLIREQVFVGIYFSREKLRHWQGSFTLTLSATEEELTGYYSGFEETRQSIVSSPYKMTKLPN
jgi:hypothetical protein